MHVRRAIRGTQVIRSRRTLEDDADEDRDRRRRGLRPRGRAPAARGDHDVHVFEAGAYAGGHTNTVRVDDARRARYDVDTGFIVFNDRNYPNFERLLAGSASPPSRRDMSFGGQRRARRLRVRQHLAQRPVRQARAPRVAVLPPDGRRRRALPARGARAARPSDEDPSLARLARGPAASRAPFVERLIVPQAAAVWSADPQQMWSVPRALPGPSSSTTTACSACATARNGARSAAARARYVEALIAPLARPAAPVDAGRRDRRAATTASRSTPRGGEPERFDEVVLATHADQALAMLARRRPTASASCSARSPTSPTRRSCTPTRRCSRAAAARGRAGTTTCSTRPPGLPTVTYHMNRLQSLRADREFCVTLNRTEAIDPGEDHAHDRTTPTRSSRARASPPRRAATRSAAAAAARTSAAPTGAGASTRTASSAACASRARSGSRRRDRRTARSTRARCATAASPAREHAFRHRIAHGLPRPRRAAGAARRPPGRAAARASCASAAATTSATRRVPLAEAVRDAGRRAHRRARPTARSGC